MNKKNNMIKCLLFNLQYFSFIEILSIKDWTNRKCNIQKNWQKESTFIDLSYAEDLDVHILINKKECYINIQNYLVEQIEKNAIANENIPKAAKEFILSEPVYSLGTTNLFWAFKDKMFFYERTIWQNELNFILTFFNKANHNFAPLLSVNIDDKLSSYITNSVYKGEVKIDILKNIFNVEINDKTIEELSDIGLDII